MIKADILIKNATILTMNESDEILTNANLSILGDSIIHISPKEVDAKKVIDASGKIVMPGLINAHNHAGMTLLRGYADDYSLDVWLQKYIWPAEAKYMNEKTVKLGTQLAIAEMIKSGTTFFNDMYFWEESVIEAAKEAGIKVCAGEGFIDYPNSSYNIDKKFDYIEGLFKKHKNDSLVKISVSPHAPYTCKKDTLIKAKEIAKKYNSTYQIHLAETENEKNLIPNNDGKSPVEYMNGLGLIDDKFVMFHGVYLSDKDREILKKHNAKVIYNPISNYKLASGSAEIYKLIKMGIDVGLGTDGATSNNNLNMFKEMNMAALVQKVVAKNPAEMTAKQVVSMATKGSAKALHVYSETGSLEVGKRADIIIINPNDVHSTPMYDVYSYLVYSANSNDVETVIINGKPVYENRKFLTIDTQKIITEVKEISAKIKHI